MADESRALEVLATLLDLPPEAREARLLAECGEDAALQVRVRELLAADAEDDPLVDGRGPGLMMDLLAREMTVEVDERGARPDDLPDRIGPYRVLAVLGSGSAGVVYEAEQSSPQRRVAVKVLRDDTASDHARQRFLDEAQALSELHHPSVPYVIEAGPRKGGVFIAMELVHGLAFRDAVGDLDEPSVLQVFHDLCQGVAHVHAGGWVHRDLKPSNVRITPDGRPKLLDFGMALSLGNRGSIAGTLDYVSPEQAAGGAGEASSDVYAVGVMLYEALLGRTPIDCRGQAFVDAARAKRGPIDFAGLSPSMALLLRRCLAVEPASRYPSAAELAAALHRVLTSQPLDGSGPRLRAVLALRRHRTAARVLAGLALLGTIGAAGAAWTARRAHHVREAAAAQSLVAMQRARAELTDKGRADEAAAVFETWSGLPENQHTGALTEAWLARANELTEPAPVRQALANALASAQGDARRLQVLHALAGHLRDTGRWASLGHSLGAIERAGGRPPLDDQVASLAGRRRLREAAALLDDDGVGPVLDALSYTAPTGSTGHDVYPADNGQLWFTNPNTRTASLMARGVPPQPLHRMPMGASYNHVPRGFGWRGVGHLFTIGRNDGRLVNLTRVAPGEAPEVLNTNMTGPLAGVASADLDGDGVEELYYGTGAYSRTVFRIDEPGAEPRPIIAPDERQGSDVVSMVTGDFDNDGKPELAVSTSRWKSNQIRVYEPAPDGWLRAIAVIPVDGVLQTLPDPEGGDQLVVLRGLEGRGQRGLAVYRVREGAATTTTTVPAPPSMGQGVYRLVRGDFDGDGLVDLAAAVTAGVFGETWLLRQTAPGQFAHVLVDEFAVAAAMDLDGDGDDELFAALDDSTRVICGAGEEALPRLGEQDAPLPPDRPAFATARELAGLGLVQEAADHLAQLARIAVDPAAASEFWLAAATLEHSTGDIEQALEHLESARGVGAANIGPIAALAAQWHADVHDFSAAQRWLHEVDEPDPSLAQAVADALAVQSDIDWADLDAGWRTTRPSALRIDGHDLYIDGYRPDGTVLARTFTFSEARAGVEFELDIDRIEAGMELLVGLYDSTKPNRQLMLSVGSWGGNGEYKHNIGCVGRNVPNEGVNLGWFPAGPADHTVRVRLSVEGGRQHCSIQADGKQWVSLTTDVQAPRIPEQVDFAIRLRGDRTVPNPSFRGRLGPVRIRGGRPAPVEPDGHDLARLAWMQTRQPAQVDLPVTAPDAEWLALLGQTDAVTEWMAKQPVDQPQILTGLRRSPHIIGPIVDRAFGERAARVHALAWSSSLPAAPHDPEWLRLAPLLDDAVLETRDDAERLQEWARILEDAGQAERARAVRARIAAHPVVDGVRPRAQETPP